MLSQLKFGPLRDSDYRAVDLRDLAEPIAVLSPVALVIGWGSQEVVMTLVSVLFVLHSWRVSDFSWARRGWFVALLALWAYELARTIVDHPTATGILTALQWIHFPLYAAALAQWILPDEKSRNRLLWAAGGALTFAALDCLLQYFSGRDVIGMPAWENRLTGLSHKPGIGIEISWLMAAPILGFWRKGTRVFAIFLGIVCSVAVLLSGDRVALLTLLGAPILIALFARSMRKPLLIALPFVAALLGSILYFSPTMYHRQIETTEQVISHFDQSPYGIILQSAFEMARDHPIFGVGAHNYQTVCLQEQYGPVVVGTDQIPRCQGHPHNVYMQWLVEGGLIGMGLYVAFVLLSLGALVRWRRENLDNLIFYGLAASLALRFWPMAPSTSFYSSWAAEPLFLILGWSLAYCRPQRVVQNSVDDGTGLSSSVARVSDARSVGA